MDEAVFVADLHDGDAGILRVGFFRIGIHVAEEGARVLLLEFQRRLVIKAQGMEGLEVLDGVRFTREAVQR
jgi:hypothetical protein